MDFEAELLYLLKAKAPCIWVKTYETDRFIKSLKNIMLDNFPNYKLETWNYFSGVKLEPRTKYEKIEEPRMVTPDRLLLEIQQKELQEGENCFYVFKDFHLVNDVKTLISGIREVKETKANKQSYIPIIVVSPTIAIPMEQQKLFSILEFTTPDKDIILNLFRGYSNAINKKNPNIIITDETINKCVNYAFGLTFNEIRNYIKLSIAQYKTLNEEVFEKARLDLIRRTGILQYSVPKMNLDEMGGNENFKEWIDDVRITFLPEATDFGVKKSKGYLSLGIPGTAKTIAAQMISSTLKLPLLKFDISKIMHSHVGQSEKNMSEALNVIKACSPCVLFIDEVEKALAGTSSSDRVDGGTLMRVVGQLLEYLSSEESRDVFTIMTSNDVSALPPELTRSGRLDTIWYFGLPSEEERKEIFKIHFKKNKKENIEENLLNYAAISTENYTGAEIEQIVIVAIRKAFKRIINGDNNTDLIEEDIDKAINEIVPVYKAYKEKILYLEDYAKNRAKYASSASKKTNNSSAGDDIISIQ